MLTVKNLTAVNGPFSIVISDLALPPGQITALMGKSGAGKSSLIHALAGFLPTLSGEIRVGERALENLPPEKRGISLLFQNPALFPHLNVIQNIEFGLRIRGIARPVRRQRAEKWLADFQIGELATRRSHQVSGGQAQRIALARSLIVENPVLFLDEAFTGLDEKTSVDLQQFLKRWVSEKKISTLFITHRWEETFRLADRVLLMDDGKLVFQGPPSAAKNYFDDNL